ncbi:MAG: hypothetical protein WAM29_13890 [Methylocella sp.]
MLDAAMPAAGRDKIAGSKHKGLWAGGPVPLGDRCIDKKLEIVPEEAEAVHTIFTRYLELGSMGALIAELVRSPGHCPSAQEPVLPRRGHLSIITGTRAPARKNYVLTASEQRTATWGRGTFGFG